MLLGPDDAVLSDELNHASIIDGIRLCRAKRLRYKHMDLSDLENKLQEAQVCVLLFLLKDLILSSVSCMSVPPNIFYLRNLRKKPKNDERMAFKSVVGISSSVFSHAPDRDRRSLLYGRRCGSSHRHLRPGWTVRSHGVHRWVPRHWLSWNPWQVSSSVKCTRKWFSLFIFVISE